MKLKLRVPIRDSRGQATVELALILPVLLLLLLAILQLGIVFHNYLALTDAVRVGARVAAVSRNSANPAGDAEARLREAAVNLDGAKLTVQIDSTWEAADPVTVKATYPYAINLLGIVVKSGDLASTTVERVE